MIVERGSCSHYMGLFLQTGEQVPTIVYAVVFHTLQLHVRLRAQQLLQQVALKARVDVKSDDHRRNARGDPDDRNRGDDADDGLSPLGAKVTGSHEQFKIHGRSRTDGRRSKNYFPARPSAAAWLPSL